MHLLATIVSIGEEKKLLVIKRVMYIRWTQVGKKLNNFTSQRAGGKREE